MGVVTHEIVSAIIHTHTAMPGMVCRRFLVGQVNAALRGIHNFPQKIVTFRDCISWKCGELIYVVAGPTVREYPTPHAFPMRSRWLQQADQIP